MASLRPLLAALVLSAAVFPAMAPAASSTDKPGGNTYTWIDKNGERQYGDSVPPEYAQGELRVLNSQGVETQRASARLSADQAAAERLKEQTAAEKAQHDRFLLTTYTSTKDIERLRDERLDQIDGQIKAAVLYIDSLDARLRKLQLRAQAYKPYSTKPDARRLPDDLAEELARGANETRAQRKALEARRKELTEVRVQFDTDINRFRELTAKNSG